MTLSEFKAWFEGYTEDMDKAPTEKQWKKIKKRVAEIDGVAVTERVYIDRYRGPYWYYNPGSVICGSVSTSDTYSADMTVSGTATTLQNFNSASAMYALGKSEAAS